MAGKYVATDPWIINFMRLKRVLMRSEPLELWELL